MKHLIIEKLVSTNVTEAEILDPCYEIRKLVDMYCRPITDSKSIRIPYPARDANSNFILRLPRVNNIHVGEEFGYNGLTVNQLLSTDIEKLLGEKYPESIVVFEIEEYDIQKNCAAEEVKFLFENYNILITETKESGLGTIDSMLITHYPNPENLIHWEDYFIKHNIQPKQIYIYHINMSTDRPDNFVNKFNIQLLPGAHCFWYHVLSFKYNREPIVPGTWEDRKLYLLPIHKPRPDRLRLLEEMDNIDLLSEGEWSLFLNPNGVINEVGKKSKVFAPGHAAFIMKYKDILPKTVEGHNPNLNSSAYGILASNELSLDPFYINPLLSNFKCYIGAETTIREPYTALLSEKIFKGFGLGIPVVVHSIQGSIEHLETLGFNMTTAKSLGYDHILDPEERTKVLANAIPDVDKLDIKLLEEEGMYNLERFHNVTAMAEEIIRPLYEIL